MITLTTPVPIPNLTRSRVIAVILDDPQSTASVQVTIGAGGGRNLPTVSLAIRNTQLVGGVPVAGTTSDGLAVNGAPTSLVGDLLERVAVTTPTGYDTIEAAYRSGGNKNAAFRAVEQALLTLGIFGSGLGGSVS